MNRDDHHNNPHHRSFFIYLHPQRLHHEISAVTPSSVLQRVPPHQPPPPRPFWLRLLPQHRGQRGSSTTTGVTTNDVYAPAEAEAEFPAVIFEATILRDNDPDVIQEEEVVQEELPPLRELKKRRISNLFRFSGSRQSVSMPSMSRRDQSRNVLSEVLSSRQQQQRYSSEAEEEEEEKHQEEESDEAENEPDPDQSTLSSSVIRVLTASMLEGRSHSAPPVPVPSRTRVPDRSDDRPDHSLWIRADIEPGIRALRGSYAGKITQHTPTAIFVEEIQSEAVISIPHYIGKLRGWYTEIECREIFRNMCRLVRILHKHRTVHRNLHLNQFLVNPNTGEFSIRGIFDAAYLEYPTPDKKHEYYTEKPIHPDSQYRRRYDWFAFRSPELDTYEVSPRHGAATDVWSLGVCLYTLLTGIPPFRGSGRALRHSKMTAQVAPYEITVPSSSAQDLIARMIVVNPICRLTIREVLDHPWMQNSFATDVDLSLTQTLYLDWDNRSSSHHHHQRRRRRRARSAQPRRPSDTTSTNSSTSGVRWITVGRN